MCAKRFGATRQAVAVVGLMAGLCLPAMGAGTLSAEGWGDSRQTACRQALASLAESLQVRVQSEFRMQTESRRQDGGRRDTDTQSSQAIVTRSDLPILGADRNVMRRDGEFVCDVTLRPDRASRFYEERLQELRTEAAGLENELSGASDDSERYRLIADLLAVLDRYRQFATVARFLGENVPPATDTPRARLDAELNRLQSAFPSLATAARHLSRDLPDGLVFVAPAHPVDSGEVTPFARALADELAAHLTTTRTPDRAAFEYRGQYQRNEDGLSVTYRLANDRGVIVAVRRAQLSPEAYGHLRTEPRTTSFDRLLHQGLAVDDAFRAGIATDRGRRDLLFRAGEEVELLIKMNRPGYYYLTGHTVRDGESYSYLVPLQDARGARRFVRYMDAEQTNKWVSLGAFEVSPPYGVESMQMVASSKDLVGDLPPRQYDEEKGLYLLGGTASEGVRKTRALIPKKKEEVRSAEAVLMFTTAPGGTGR